MGRHICNGLGVHDARVDWPHSDVAVVGGLAYSLRALKKLPDGGWKVFRAMGTTEWVATLVSLRNRLPGSAAAKRRVAMGRN